MRNLKFDDIGLLDGARAPSDARAIWCTISRESPGEFRSNFYGWQNRGHAQSRRPADRPDRTTHVRKKEIEKKKKQKRNEDRKTEIGHRLLLVTFESQIDFQSDSNLAHWSAFLERSTPVDIYYILNDEIADSFLLLQGYTTYSFGEKSRWS